MSENDSAGKRQTFLQDFKRTHSEKILAHEFSVSEYLASSRCLEGLALCEAESYGMAMAVPLVLADPPEDSSSDMEQSKKDAAAPGGWEHEIGTYLWMADVNGDMGADGVVVEMDEKFKDMLEIIEWGGALVYKLRKDRWRFFTDVMYMALEDDEKIAGIKIETTTRQAISELGAGYRIRIGERDMFIEPLLGLRYIYMKNIINVKGGPSVDGTTNWLDLIVGGWFEAELSKKLALSIRGDAGGFGIGSASDLTWLAMAELKWHVTQNTDIGFGYRHMDMDYDHSGIIFDAYLTGPFIGVNYRF
ncbi:MAG: hypothetical protein ACYTG7_12110 [Planctomycetota bacterium]|jgi:hypothetical protein